jgi:hypothetical protein
VTFGNAGAVDTTATFSAPGVYVLRLAASDGAAVVADTVTVSVYPPVYPVGDLNCDGLVNNGDIDPFILALTDPMGYALAYPSCGLNLADINGDGLVNNGDIDAFVALLTGG